MSLLSFIDSNVFSWVVLPLLIFLARIMDVSLATLRVVFISKGFKFLAPILGFFEILIWLVAIRQIFNNLSNFVCYIAYAAGFSAGTFIGMCIENKLSFGRVIVRIITGKDASNLLEELKMSRYTATNIGAEGPEGQVKMIFTVIQRKDVPKIVGIIKKHNPSAFYSVEDVRMARDDVLKSSKKERFNFFDLIRKGK